jgi:hypothetical protein
VPDSDHISIAKPADEDALQHRLLIQFVQEFIEETNNLIKDQQQNLLDRLNSSSTRDVRIPQLIGDLKKISKPDNTGNSSLELRGIIEGQSMDSASRVFEITISNPSKEQILLTDFKVNWHYHHGNLCSVDKGVALKAVAKYVIKLPINTDDNSEKTLTELLYPPVAIPPVNESGPSLTVLQLQLYYYFDGRIDWHPCCDWNIIFDLEIIDDSGRSLTVFSHTAWKS